MDDPALVPPGGLNVAEAPDPLCGRMLEGRYEIRAPLAQGGMATVYLAIDTRLDREVAIKIMHSAFAHDPAFVQRFEREAKSVARINHPNVVAVHDTGLERGPGGPVVFLVMELVRGKTLRDLIDERGRLSPAQALDVLEPMLSALVAAHDAGLVHRDIKPENVLLADTGGVKVVDFGLARAAEASSLTAHGGWLLGTVAYLAPEQVTQGTADPRTDVYAAGIVLFEMLTGRVPFTAATSMAVAYKHVHETVPAPSSVDRDIPGSLDALVALSTATDPDSRYRDAAAFLVATRQTRRALPAAPTMRRHTMALPIADHLTEALPSTTRAAYRSAPATATAPARPGPARSTGPPVNGALPRRRRRWIPVLVILLLLSAGAGAAGWWFGSGRYVHVPALSRLTITAATARLHGAHLDPAPGATTYSDTVPFGQVVSTTPVAGSRVVHGKSVTIHLSQGVQMVAVPDVGNMALAGAEATLRARLLTVGQVKEGYSTNVTAGKVIATSPGTGTTVRHGRAIDLTVSQGPQPVELPDLTNDTTAQSSQILTGLGLTASVASQQFSDSVQSGSVISQHPPAGTVHVGDQIALVVSKGPELVLVPNVYGMTAAEAKSTLTDAGLKVNEKDLLYLPGTVIYQTPQGGAKKKPGTTVLIGTA